MNFQLHNETTAPEAARDGLARTNQNFCMIPNLEKVMAAAPSLLSGYSALWDLFNQTTLSPIERQVVYLTANYENECEYGAPWHSFLARKAGMDTRSIEALRFDFPGLESERGPVAPSVTVARALSETDVIPEAEMQRREPGEHFSCASEMQLEGGRDERCGRVTWREIDHPSLANEEIGTEKIGLITHPN